MAKKTQKSTKKGTKEIANAVILCLVILPIGFGALVYAHLPALSDFRNSIYGLLVSFFVLAGLILCVTLSRKIAMPLLGKITVWAFAPLYLSLSLLDLGKIELLFYLVYAVANVCIAVFLYRKRGVAYKSIWLFGAFSYFVSTIVVLRVKYLHGELNPTFLWLSVAVAVLAFVPFLIYGIWHFKMWRDWEKLIAVPLAALLGGFIIAWLTVASMNVYLDTSVPVREEYTVIEKDVTTGSRQVTTYKFKVEKDGAVFWIGVSETAYRSHEINDIVTLSTYNGAFHQPYYIHDPSAP